MYIINYYNMEYVSRDKEELKNLNYKCKDADFDYWLNVIQKSYGKHGEVTYQYFEDPKSQEQIQSETINGLVIENMKQDLSIASINQAINNIIIRLNKLEGGK